MVRIIIASHGGFADGLDDTSKMIFGQQDEVDTICILPSEGPESFKAKVIEATKGAEQVLFLVDLWGGTPFNQINELMVENPTWSLVTGANVPMIIEAFVARNSMTTAREIAMSIMESSKASIRAKDGSEEYQASAPVKQGGPKKIPEGAVVGDGKINYVYVRVDTRLLHGQVATTWTKEKQPDRIIIASDKVSKDELRKTMIVQAAPPGVKVHVIPLDHFVKISKDTRFGGTKMMILFETPQEALYCIEKGVDLKSVCLGSMAASTSKVVVSRALAFDQGDVDTIQSIVDSGVNVYAQVIPSEGVTKWETLLHKAEELLK